MVVLITLLSGCNKIPSRDINTKDNTTNSSYKVKNDNNDEVKEVKEVKNGEIEHIEDYYPFKENRRMYYKGEGNEYASQDVYVDFIKGDKIQIRVNNSGTVLAQVIQNSDGELKLLASEEEFYYRQNIIDKVISDYEKEILLKEPLVVGTSWNTSGNIKTITAVDKNISTPSGNYKALEVTNKGKEFEIKEYYVKGLGFVKSVFTADESEISTSLQIVEEKLQTQTIKFYYPLSKPTNFVVQYKKIAVKLKTNDNIKDFFDKYFKLPPVKDAIPLMSKNTVINKLYINRDENKVYVDFSKEFILEMNAGAEAESVILKSVVNTLGDYFNVDKVYLTIDGKTYSSGHIELKNGEVFYVDYKDVDEMK